MPAAMLHGSFLPMDMKFLPCPGANRISIAVIFVETFAI